MHFVVPDGSTLSEALARTTHLGIGAHPDDLEFMALHGILECHGRSDRHFTGVTMTTGARAPRAGSFAQTDDAELAAIRRREQDEAAHLGGYSAQVQLGFDSLKGAADRTRLVDQLHDLLEKTRPEIIYTHNPADRHPTHLAAFTATIRAIRRLPAEARPRRMLGCEVWRDLDWLPAEFKVALDVSAHPDLAAKLRAVFRSQIEGGKRYDLAVAGRQLAHATFSESHATDAAARLSYAMNLTPMLEDDRLDPTDFLDRILARFRGELLDSLREAS